MSRDNNHDILRDITEKAVTGLQGSSVTSKVNTLVLRSKIE